MERPHLCFRACLAALLMLAAVPAKAADVKELFATDLADYPGKGASPSCPATATPADASETQPANLLTMFVVDTNETEPTIPFGN